MCKIMKNLILAGLLMIASIPSVWATPTLPGSIPNTGYAVEVKSGHNKKDLTKPAVPEITRTSKVWKPQMEERNRYRNHWLYWSQEGAWVNVTNVAFLKVHTNYIILRMECGDIYVCAFRSSAEANAAMNIIRKGYSMNLPPYRLEKIAMSNN